MWLWRRDRRHTLSFQPSGLFTVFYMNLLVAVCRSADIETPPAASPYKPQVVPQQWNMNVRCQKPIYFAVEKMDSRVFLVVVVVEGWGGLLDLAAHREDFISCWHFHSVNSLFLCKHKAVPTGYEVDWLIESESLHVCLQVSPFGRWHLLIFPSPIRTGLKQLTHTGKCKQSSASWTKEEVNLNCASSLSGEQTYLVESCEVVVLCMTRKLLVCSNYGRIMVLLCLFCFHLNRCQ